MISRFLLRIIFFGLCVYVAYRCGYENYINESSVLDDNDRIMTSLEEVTGNRKYEAVYYQQILSGQLSDKIKEEMAEEIIDNLDGEVIEKHIFSNSPSGNKNETVYGYTHKIDNYIDVMGEKVNLNVVFSYDEESDSTNIYLATPIHNYDY